MVVSLAATTGNNVQLINKNSGYLDCCVLCQLPIIFRIDNQSISLEEKEKQQQLRIDNGSGISCYKCNKFSAHYSCLGFDQEMQLFTSKYSWECNECKTCENCGKKDDETNLLLCDQCDRGYHLYCCEEPLKKKPIGKWFCERCYSIKNHSNRTTGGQFKTKSYQINEEKSSLEGSPTSLSCPSRIGPPSFTFDGILTQEEAVTQPFIPTSCDILKYQTIRRVLANNTTATSNAYLQHNYNNRSSKYGNKGTDKKCMNNNRPSNKTPLPKIKRIVIGNAEVNTWYNAPYPAEYVTQIGTLWICERCLKYMKSEDTYNRHLEKCDLLHPPGDEIYRSGSLAMFEVNGRSNKMYCQNLCLLAKLFLDHKTLYYDVEPFLFYILTEIDIDGGYHFVGYFSKEKHSLNNYNLSCIITLPCHQRKGYGFFLIDFSYLLSRKEKKIGTPEKPLSDLGLLAYKNYWSFILLDYFLHNRDLTVITISEIERSTALTYDDIFTTLEWLDFIKQTPEGTFIISIDDVKLQEFQAKYYHSLSSSLFSQHPHILRAKPERLLWKPVLSK